jgi:hypothetical protein
MTLGRGHDLDNPETHEEWSAGLQPAAAKKYISVFHLSVKSSPFSFHPSSFFYVNLVPPWFNVQS